VATAPTPTAKRGPATSADEYVYTGTAHTYPELRDGAGVIVGSVRSGAIRAFKGAPPDTAWTLAADDEKGE
jgi:hypothetical protein